MLLRYCKYVLVSLSSVLLMQCGGRTGLQRGDAGAPSTPCTQDADCVDGNGCVTRACVNNYCAIIAHKDCEDNVYCTADSCDESTGECLHQWKTSDNDQDGFYAPLPGTKPGAPDACGDDCNDTQASVYPGAPEICDGFDNNCDGRTDEGTYTYRPVNTPVRVTNDSITEGGPSGLAYNGKWFGLSFTGTTDSKKFQGYFASYDAWASNIVPMKETTQTSQFAYGGPLLWTGSVYATVWEVRGQGGYDIWFNQLDSEGQKMGPDLRVTDVTGFSINPSLLLSGDEHWVVWAESDDDTFRIRGRKISGDRQLAGDILELTDTSSDGRTPTLIRSPTSTLLLFVSSTNKLGVPRQLRGRILDSAMNPVSDEILISGPGVSNYSADWVEDRFVVAWTVEEEDGAPGDSVWAAALDANGMLTLGERRITSGATFARTTTVLSLGDRFALAWADDRDSYNRYAIRMSTYDTNLTAVTDVQTLTNSNYSCFDPTLASGGFGLALMYRERIEDKTGFPYFVGLTCDYFER